MRHRLFPLLTLGLPAVILAAGCGEELPTAPRSGEGYPRVVLAELFTTTWCGWCPTAEEALDHLFDEEGPGKLAVIHWHPSYGQGDPFAIPESDTRAEMYPSFIGNPPGFPVCVFDGLAYFRGGWTGLYDDYRSRFQAEAAYASPVRIAIEPAIMGNSAEIDLLFESQSFLVGGTYDLVVAIVEHHAVEGQSTTSYVARTALTEDIALHAEHDHEYTVELALEPDWKREDLWAVAFVQQREPSSGQSFREVLQAAMTPLLAEEEDFYAFYLSAPDTTVSVAAGGEREFPFTIQNTGTLDDTLTVDLPTALFTVPESWTVGLRTGDGAELVTPSSSLVAAGESIGSLRLRVLADSAGSGTIAITCASSGDPALADTLAFRVAAGTFGLMLQADATDLDVLSGVPHLAPFVLENTGTVDDDISVDLPDSLADVPSGWKFSLVDRSGSEIPHPYTVGLTAGGRQEELQLRVLAVGEGAATVGLTAASQGDPALVRTLTFVVTARSYNFDLAAESTELQVVVGTPATVPFTISNTGARDDLLVIDLPAVQEMPPDWEVALTYNEVTEVPTPHYLLLEAGSQASGFGLRVDAGSGGDGTVRLIAASTGDPSLVDTLRFQVSADEYGLALSAPQGTAIRLEPGAATLIPFALENRGTLEDRYVVDLPAEGIVVPVGWEIFLADARQNEISVPLEVTLAAGEMLDTLFIRALAAGGGNGSVSLSASSLGLPSLTGTLDFALSASLYGFDVEAETDVEVEEFPGFTMAPFTLVNTGSLDDVLTISAPTSLQIPAPSWGPAIICDDEQCYPPNWQLDIPVAQGESVRGYYLDWFIPSAGTGAVALVVVSQGDPALADTLTFTFTAGPLRSLAQRADPQGSRWLNPAPSSARWTW